MSEGSSSDSAAVQAVKQIAAAAQQAYLDEHEDEIQNGTDKDKRRIRLKARQIRSAKYKEELENAVRSTETEKQLLLALIESAQEESKRIREELARIEEEDEK